MQVLLDLFQVIEIRVATRCTHMLFRPWIQKHRKERRGGYEKLPILTKKTKESQNKAEWEAPRCPLLGAATTHLLEFGA